MTQAATCTPGQEVGSVQTVAPSGGIVLITPAPGATQDFGSDEGLVELVDPANPTAPVTMSVSCLDPGDPLRRWCPAWSPDVVAAQFPMTIPAPGEDADLERLFSVRITTAGGTTFEAAGVAIVGPPGSGYPTQPPTHHLFGVLSERQLTGVQV